MEPIILSNKLNRKTLSRRELILCDDLVNSAIIDRAARFLETLRYQRTERSRDGANVSGAVANISETAAASEPLFQILKDFGVRMFPGETFRRKRIYANSTVHGDMYYPHRDCESGKNDVTILYYANKIWEKDWGGETIFYDEEGDIDLAVWPRPGRVVAFRSAILHRGGMPLRICYEERRTIAYKLLAM